MPATLLLSSPLPRGQLRLQHAAAALGNLRPTWLPGRRAVLRSAGISSPVPVIAQQDSGQDVPDTSAPKPRTAWNKGQKMAASSRRKLSQALKKKWKDPEHRKTVSEKLKGVEPWNKGRTLSEETRLKMSLAKRNRTVGKATRQRMSASHRGKAHSQETTQLLSQMATGQPKSAEHIAHISAGQRRRHAAARVLRAVEAVYEAQGATASGGNGNGVDSVPLTAQVTAVAAAIDPAAPPRSGKQAEPSASGAAAVAAAVAAAAVAPDAQGGASLAAMQSLQASRLAAYRVSGGNGLASSGGGGSSSGGSKKRRMSRAQILAEYKAELQEYRALQEELSPWSNAFVEKNGRKPGMQDVLATGIVWLITRYKQYILLRDRLFTDTGTLRSRLDTAIPDMDSGMPSINGQGAAASQSASLNANGAAGARSAAAARFSAAMEYKAARKAGSAAAAAPKQQDERQQQAAPAQAAAAAAAAPLQQQQQRPEADGPAAAGSALEEGPLLSPNVPPRVRLAMMAAQEYRQKKAQATKALATAAAAAAKAGFSSPRPAQAAGSGSPAGAPGQGSGAAAAPAALASGAGAAAAAARAAAAPAAVNGSANGHPSSGSPGANGHDSAAAVPAAPAAPAPSGRRAAERRQLPAVDLPAEVVLTQAAAHAAVEEARRAEDSMRRALQLSTASIDEEMEGARHEVGFA